MHLISSRARGNETWCSGIPSDERGVSAGRAGACCSRLRRPERGRVVPVRPYRGTPQHTEQEDLRGGTAQTSRLAHHLLLHRPGTPGRRYCYPRPPRSASIYRPTRRRNGRGLSGGLHGGEDLLFLPVQRDLEDVREDGVPEGAQDCDASVGRGSENPPDAGAIASETNSAIALPKDCPSRCQFGAWWLVHCRAGRACLLGSTSHTKPG